MIEVNFLDARGAKILLLNTKEDIENFFENRVNCSSAHILGKTTINYSLV